MGIFSSLWMKNLAADLGVGPEPNKIDGLEMHHRLLLFVLQIKTVKFE
jgi:hypothetical protein